MNTRTIAFLSIAYLLLFSFQSFGQIQVTGSFTFEDIDGDGDHDSESPFWDVSRNIKVEYFNPNPTSVVAKDPYLGWANSTELIASGISWPSSYELLKEFPNPLVVGNDDNAMGDEDYNPYSSQEKLMSNTYSNWTGHTSAKGLISSFDGPNQWVKESGHGEENEDFTTLFSFHEFVRLKNFLNQDIIISDNADWIVTREYKKINSKWTEKSFSLLHN